MEMDGDFIVDIIVESLLESSSVKFFGVFANGLRVKLA
jgi:hypothetical protein